MNQHASMFRRASICISRGLDTCGHFAKILIIFYTMYKHMFIEPIISNTFEWSKWSRARQRASCNPPTHRQWRFWRRSRGMFNTFATIKSYYHTQNLLINCIVKGIVEIGPFVIKLEWFAGFVPALTTTRVQMQPKYSNFLPCWRPWLSSI